MKKRTKRLLAMLLASAMIMQQGSTVAVLATESEPASETVTEKTVATEAKTKAPETQAETKAPETTAPETQAVSETQATEAAVNATQTETTTSETTETVAETTENATEATETQEATEVETEEKAVAEEQTDEVSDTEDAFDLITLGADTPMTISVNEDIKSFLAGAEFYKDTTLVDSSTGSVELEPDVTYSLNLRFAENSAEGGNQLQMGESDDTLVYTYEFPAGFPLTESGYTEKEFKIEGGYDIKGKYKVQDGKLVITINKNDNDSEAWESFLAARNVAMSFSFDFKYTEDIESKSLQFSDTIQKTVTVKTDNGVTLEKIPEYNEATGVVTYKVYVTSKGYNENIKVTDSLNPQNDFFIPQKDVKVYKSKDLTMENLLDLTPTYSDDGKKFELTIPEMRPGDVYTITYSEKVDYSKFNGKIDGWKTLNNIKAKPEDGTEDNKSVEVEISHTRVKKDHGEIGGADAEGNVTIPWTVTINEDQLEDLAGEGTLTITDTATDMKYCGEGIKVTVKKKDGSSQGTILKWEDLGVNISSATSWTISNLIEKLSEKGIKLSSDEKYSITLDYSTTANVMGASGEKSFKNNVDFNGSKAEGEAKVPGTGTVGLEKTVADEKDAEHKIQWKVNFTVKGTVMPCDFVDTVPSGYMESGGTNWHEYDEIDTDRSNIEVTGLCSGEDWEIVKTTDATGNEIPGSYTFRFYHTGTEGEKIYGLTSHAGHDTHNIVVKFWTKTNQKWLEMADEMAGKNQPSYTHKNTVKSGDASGSAEVEIRPKSLVKRITTNSNPSLYLPSDVPKTVEIDGVIYPVFCYTLLLTGVSGRTATITDTFDPAELKYYPGDKFGPFLRSGEPYNCYDRGGTLEVDLSKEAQGEITFKLSNLPETYEEGKKCTHYAVVYCMIPASKEARNELLNEGTAYTNTADYAGHTDSESVEWDYKPLTKTLTASPTSENRTASFEIDFNPSKVDYLSTTSQLTITDSMEHLRLVSDSLKVWADEVELSAERNEYSYDFNESGELVIVIPDGDGKHISITYDAKVIGQNETEVEFSNTVRVSGVGGDASANGKVTLHTNGGGTFSNIELTLYKYMKGFMRHPLEGAEYRLEMAQEGDAWKVVNKKNTNEPYIFTTDSDGKILISDTFLKANTDVEFYTDKDFRLVEVKAPEGYTLDDTPVPFRINTDGSTGGNAYLPGDTIYVDNAKENFHIVKKDEEKDDDGNDVLLEGAEFSLYGTLADAQSETGVAIKTARTDAEGIASFADLEADTYYLKETAAPEGYDLPVPNLIYQVNIDVEGNVTTSSGEGFVKIPSFVENSGTITNSKSEEKGSLTVTKAVTGDKAPTGDVKYEVEITTDDDVDLNTDDVIVKDAVDGSVNKEAKKISFKITAGGSVTVTGLPQATYTVTETSADGVTYTASYVVDEGSSTTTAPTVTFTKDKTTATVAITNDYGNKTGSLTVTKAVAGDKAPTTEEKYEVEITTSDNVNLNTTDVVVTGAVDDSVNKEAKKISFKITAGGSVTVTGLPQATYTVTETLASGATYTASYVVDEGSSTKTAPTVTFNTDKTDATVAITNDYGSDVGKLLVKKVVTGTKAPNPGVSYDVTVATTDTGIDLSAASVTVTGAVEGSVSKGKQQITFKIMGGKTVTIDKLPLGMYTVTETVSGTTYTASYKVDNASTISPAVTFSNTGTKKSEATVEITNDYGNKTGSLQIKKNVTVNGKETTGTEADGTYTFKVKKIKKDGETAEKTVSITIENGKSGTVTVDNLEPGTYMVTEVTDGLSAKNIHLVGTNGVTVTVVDSETVTTVPTAEFTNNKVKLEIDKIDATTETSMKGATLQIVERKTSGEEEPVAAWVTTGQPHDVTGVLEAGKKYTLKELAAPAGYTLADPVDFEVNADGKIVVNGEEVYSFVMKDTKNKVSILKVDESGKALAGATLIVKDKDGKVVAGPWTTDGKAHEITGLAPGTYTLSELEAPKGYQVSENVSFEITGNETKDAVITVTMTDKKIVETKRSLKVTKHLHLDGITSDIMVRAATYYVALFTDAARTQRVTDVKKIVFNNENTSSATFDNLEAGVTYYVGETDENGTVIPAGRISENMIYYPTYDDNSTFTFEGKKAKEEGLAEFTNVYVEWPNYFYLSGQLTVTKQVLLGGEECDSDDTFYARIFNDAGLTDPVSDEVLVLDMAGGSRTSVTVTNLPIGDKPGSSRKYYVAETDEYGNPLDPDEVTEYTISVDKSEITLDASSGTPEVVITNDFHEEESEFESESEVDEEKTAPKTGEDTDYAKYLFLLTLSAGTCAVLFEEKRRKNQTRQ